MAVSVSVTFPLIFRNSHILEKFLLATLVYSCSIIFRPFCNLFSGDLSIKMSILYMINLNTVENKKKNWVEIQGFQIQQFLFMKMLTYIKPFVPAVPNTIGFAREINSSFRSWSRDPSFSFIYK